VKLVDANVLIYAVNSDSAPHDQARDWLDSSLNGGETVAFAWIVLLAFLRLTTNPHAFAQAWSVADACDQIEEWLSRPAAVTVEPTSRHVSILRGLLEHAGTPGNLSTDAHLAALAVEHGAQVVTFDRDFARFSVPHGPPG
jgi:toxin-antitoxin system PIN domain toxin